MSINIKRINIGVTQFGMTYGIMNKSNYNSRKKLRQILNFSKIKKIRAIYTSKYYGNSNKYLALENLDSFNVFTKFKCDDLLNEKFILQLNWLKKILKKKNIILVLDQFEKLTSKKAVKIYNILLNLKKQKYITKFGYSIYSFKNLQKICKKFKPDILQCPYSVIDRRLEKNKLLQYLKFNKMFHEISYINRIIVSTAYLKIYVKEFFP